MSAMLLSYDLNRPGQDYGDLIDKIKSLGAWWHHLDSTWIVTTSLTASGIRDALTPYLDANDELLVINVTGDAWASRGLSDRANTWLKENV